MLPSLSCLRTNERQWKEMNLNKVWRQRKSERRNNTGLGQSAFSGPHKSNHIKLSQGLQREMFDMSALHPNTHSWVHAHTHSCAHTCIYTHTDAEIASMSRLNSSRVKQIAKVCANKNNVWQDLFNRSLSLTHTHPHRPSLFYLCYLYLFPKK